MLICYSSRRDVVYGACAVAYSTRILLILLLVRFAPCDVHYKCLLATLVVGMLFTWDCAVAYSNRILLVLLLVRFALCDVHYKCLLATPVVGMLFMGVVQWLTLIAYCLFSFSFALPSAMYIIHVYLLLQSSGCCLCGSCSGLLPSPTITNL